MNLKAEINREVVELVRDILAGALPIGSQSKHIDQATNRLLKLFRDTALEIVGGSGKLRRSKNVYGHDTSGYMEANTKGKAMFPLELGRHRNQLRSELRAKITEATK